MYKLKFVAKSKEFPNDVKKARSIQFDIFIPPYLMTYYCSLLSIYSGSITGPVFRKRWMEFVSHSLINLFQKSGVFCTFFWESR